MPRTLIPRSAIPTVAPRTPASFSGGYVIPATGRTKTEIASLLGISRQHLYDILEERKPVSPAVAVRLGKLSATAPVSGSGCRPPTTRGMPSRAWM